MECGFQSTHPHGVRRMDDAQPKTCYCFNPRTRMGCDFSASYDVYKSGNVSIHAPAWGATLLTKWRQTRAIVSIHAPAWGATLLTADIPPPIIVSIHAPAWGATFPKTSVGITYVFQSTHPHGVRPKSTKRLETQLTMFQSTHPHGVRQAAIIAKESELKFQSTHPHGVRRTNRTYRRTHKQFQSTHPHGVRLYIHLINVGRSIVSIHAPAWGATVYSAMS